MNVQKQRVICITGMERSGTSMVTRILNIMGVYLGEKDSLILATDYNVKGCWEHRPLLEISESILRLFGGDTHNPPDFPYDWEHDSRLADLEARAKQIIQTDFADRPLWGWKDTRVCLTLPFWQKVIPDIEYIMCLRNPIDVVKSELRMNWLSSFSKGMYLWLKYNSIVARHPAGKRRLFVFYEDFFEKDWRLEARRLAEFLGPEYVRNISKYEQEIGVFIEKDLRHSAASILELMDHPEVPYSVKTFYFILKQITKEENHDVLKGLFDVSPSEALKILSRYADIDAVGALNLHKELDAKIRDLSEKDRQLIEKDRQLSEKDRQLIEKEQQLIDKDQQLRVMLNSLSWKITAPLRAIKGLLK